MANIKISDLHSTGSDLFSDSESYMNELGDSQLDIINGGSTPIIASVLVTAISASLVFSPSPNVHPQGGGGGGGGGRVRAV